MEVYLVITYDVWEMLLLNSISCFGCDSKVLIFTFRRKHVLYVVVRSNETAAFIVDCLKSETTKDDIVKKLTDTYEVDSTTAQNDVGTILSQLEQIGAIE
jgi:hypothetical protein